MVMEMFFNEKKISFEKIQKEGSTAEIFYNESEKLFLKKPTRFLEYDVLNREIFILITLLNVDIDWCPKLYYYDTEFLILEDCGQNICKDNLPSNYEYQVNKILRELKHLNIEHNDMFGHNFNLTVKNDKIYLIDYGWCSVNGDFSCGIGLSGAIKPYGIFNDNNILLKIKQLCV